MTIKAVPRLLCVIFSILFLSIPAYAQTTKVVAEGISGTSFDAAVRNAQRSAIEQGASVFIHSQTEVENFQLIKDKMFSRTEGYLAGYEILEKKREDELYWVKIEATVALDKVKNDLIALKIILESLERPKLMVLVEESYKLSGLEGMHLAETEMVSLLEAKGFEIVDKDQFALARQQDQAKLALTGNMEAAKTLGLLLGAQYVLLGKAVVYDSREAVAYTRRPSVQASLQLKILHCRSGLVLGSVVEQGVSPHRSPLAAATQALRNVSKKAIEGYAVNKILLSFQDFLNNGLPMKLHVVGVKSFSQYTQIANILQSLEKIVSCKKEMWNKATGLLVLDLRYKGTSEELAQEVDQKDVGQGKLVVEDFAAEKLDVALERL